MKVYKVSVREIHSASAAMISSYVTPRTEQKVEFYSTKELADKRANAIRDGVTKLLGYVPSLEVGVSEIDVKESCD